jgi:hypothetical protein
MQKRPVEKKKEMTPEKMKDESVTFSADGKEKHDSPLCIRP